MTATETEREVGFPWYERHAMYRGKEIWMLASNCFAGARWTSNKAMITAYANSKKDTTCDVHRPEVPGFVHYARDENDGKLFSSWEEAEAWLFGVTA